MSKERIHLTYITFGQQHRHEINGITYDKDCVAVITAPNQRDGRQKAFDLFGRKWCWEYPQREWKREWDTLLKYFPRGEIPVDYPVAKEVR